MKRVINSIFIFTILLGAANAHAQTTDTVKMKGWQNHEPAGAMQIQVTYRKGNIGQLDGVLNANGFPSIKENDYWINASMSHIFNKWMWEDGLGFTPIATSEANNVKVKYNQYQAFARLGYNVSSNTSFRLYPFVGANFSAAILNIEDRGGIRSVNTLSDELLNSTASKTFYQPNFGVELGAGFDYVIKLKPKQMDCISIERNIPIGIRAGYYINTYASNWRVEDNYGVSGGSQKQSNVFVSFNIGLGYKVNKHM